MTGRAGKRCGARADAESVRGVTCNGFTPYEVTPLPHGCIAEAAKGRRRLRQLQAIRIISA
ncbi:hypothetical protein EGD00_21555 [Pectobacterium carotovorum subsp. carotovorum]|nr:hypothetical protein EGD00_21555 [Pectobacterium carotovorum subsp. carotovorum]